MPCGRRETRRLGIRASRTCREPETGLEPVLPVYRAMRCGPGKWLICRAYGGTPSSRRGWTYGRIRADPTGFAQQKPALPES
jgi:hypothetical protein